MSKNKYPGTCNVFFRHRNNEIKRKKRHRKNQEILSKYYFHYLINLMLFLNARAGERKQSCAGVGELII